MKANQTVSKSFSVTLTGFAASAQNGECRCKPGYRGDRCKQKCEEGYYGDGCQHRCHCNDNLTCDYVTGMCLNNCDPGWMGDDCDQCKQMGVFPSVLFSLSLSLSLLPLFLFSFPLSLFYFSLFPLSLCFLSFSVGK